MTDGPLVEVLRGNRVESLHEGTAIVVDADGHTLLSIGDTESPIYPRSTVKALLAIDLVDSGAAMRAGLTQAELALACASHNGEPLHARTAAAMLAKTGRDVSCLECGTHWPTHDQTARALARSGEHPTALHNNCSGKHAGLICLACDQGHDPTGYVAPDHPIMRQVTATLESLTSARHDEAHRGTDGCSIPTYAIPLRALALGFARFGTGNGLGRTRAESCATLREAVAANPFMVAGTGRFDTHVMERFGTRAFVKMGAEGVMVASLPEPGLGIAIKIRDGANRAAEVAMAALLSRLLPDVSDSDRTALHALSHPLLNNWQGLTVGALRPAPGLA